MAQLSKVIRNLPTCIHQTDCTRCSRPIPLKYNLNHKHQRQPQPNPPTIEHWHLLHLVPKSSIPRRQHRASLPSTDLQEQLDYLPSLPPPRKDRPTTKDWHPRLQPPNRPAAKHSKDHLPVGNPGIVDATKVPPLQSPLLLAQLPVPLDRGLRRQVWRQGGRVGLSMGGLQDAHVLVRSTRLA